MKVHLLDVFSALLPAQVAQPDGGNNEDRVQQLGIALGEHQAPFDSLSPHLLLLQACMNPTKL